MFLHLVFIYWVITEEEIKEFNQLKDKKMAVSLSNNEKVRYATLLKMVEANNKLNQDTSVTNEFKIDEEINGGKAVGNANIDPDIEKLNNIHDYIYKKQNRPNIQIGKLNEHNWSNWSFEMLARLQQFELDNFILDDIFGPVGKSHRYFK